MSSQAGNLPALVDGFNVLWHGRFGFPAPISSRDKQGDLTGPFEFFALLRDALGTDRAEVCVVLDGEHGGAERKDADAGYKANRESTPAALEPLRFLAPLKEALDAYGIAWGEIDDVVGTLVHRRPDRTIRIMRADQDYYQLLDGERVWIINRSRKASKGIITDIEVLDRYGVTPRPVARPPRPDRRPARRRRHRRKDRHRTPLRRPHTRQPAPQRPSDRRQGRRDRVRVGGRTALA
ncbi:hypothetical protein [Streptomyces sp. 4F14]|uniref:hypothetical protein n=1 Tax=Streptomyces sp. 4F14 TaxID=3394380 RepID=UPI003A86FED4